MNFISHLKVALAAEDIVAGLRKSWMWFALAMQDIRLRYRGSLLGPFWLTISTVIMIASMGFIYSRIFNMEPRGYLPYLTVGIVIWQFIATVINEGCQTFLGLQSIIQQVKLPLSVHVYRLVWRNIIVLGHNFVIIPIVLVLFGVGINSSIFLLVPAFALLVLNSIWIVTLLGMFSARYRDVPPIVANFVQVAFFITPVFWSADALGTWRSVAELNPLFAAIDVVRAPLIGKTPDITSWVVLTVTTVVGCGLTFAAFARFRQRIAYWV